MTDRNKSN